MSYTVFAQLPHALNQVQNVQITVPIKKYALLPHYCDNAQKPLYDTIMCHGISDENE